MVKNVARVLQVADRLDVPFYLGADEPLLGDVIDAAYVSPPAHVWHIAVPGAKSENKGLLFMGPATNRHKASPGEGYLYAVHSLSENYPASSGGAVHGVVLSDGLPGAVSRAGWAGGCACNSSSLRVHLPLTLARDSSSEAGRGKKPSFALHTCQNITCTVHAPENHPS